MNFKSSRGRANAERTFEREAAEPEVAERETAERKGKDFFVDEQAELICCVLRGEENQCIIVNSPENKRLRVTNKNSQKYKQKTMDCYRQQVIVQLTAAAYSKRE